MMALVACKPEMVVKPESLLVGAETVHPLEKNDLEQVRQRNAAVPASAVLVPLRAIVSGESGNKDSHALAVFTVAADKHAHKVAIEGQTLWRNDLVVTSGLGAGAEIVVQGAGELYDNAPVVARPAWTGRATTAD